VSCEQWRLSADLAFQTPREAAAPHERKIWQTDVLQPSALAPGHDEMALCALEKASNSATFLMIFSVFFSVLSPLGRNWTRT
jgi:hypothetical protein